MLAYTCSFKTEDKMGESMSLSQEAQEWPFNATIDQIPKEWRGGYERLFRRGQKHLVKRCGVTEEKAAEFMKNCIEKLEISGYVGNCGTIALVSQPPFLEIPRLRTGGKAWVVIFFEHKGFRQTQYELEKAGFEDVYGLGSQQLAARRWKYRIISGAIDPGQVDSLKLVKKVVELKIIPPEKW